MRFTSKKHHWLAFVALALVTVLFRFAPVHAAQLSQENLTLAVKQSVKLKLTGASGSVSWSSSNNSIAEVQKGTVTAKKTGECRIYAVNKGKTYSCNVKVNSILGLSASDIKLVGKGTKAPLELYFGAFSPYSWSYSLDKASVVDIKEKGWGSGSRSAYYSFDIKALKSGVANLTFSNTKNSETIKVTIHVQVPEMDPATATLEKGKSMQLTLNYAKASAVKWKSSDKSVVYVNSKGKIKAKKNGTAVITATYLKKKYTCKVTVQDEDRTAGVSISIKIPHEGEKNYYCTLIVSNKTGVPIKVDKNAFFESNFVLKKCWSDNGKATVLPNNSSRSINFFRCKTASRRSLPKYTDMLLNKATVVGNVKITIGSHVYRFNVDGFGVFPPIEKLK